MTWFLFGSDGDVMGGELTFTVLSADGPGGAPVAGPSLDQIPPTKFAGLSYPPLSRAQDAARLAASASLAVLVGGVTFVAGLWWAGALVRRVRLILWTSLTGALVANAAALGLKGAAVQGRSALSALSPSAITALDGTHVGKVLMTRLGLLVLAVPVVALMTMAPERALNADVWYITAAASGLGALATHGWLSHAWNEGMLAFAAHVVHLTAISVWLGGLVILAAVVLPRRQAEELAQLVPAFSRLAFGSVVTAMVAGGALLILISPRWSALPTSAYGQLLLVKLALVVGLLVAASRARGFVRQHLLVPAAAAATAAGPSDLGVEQRPFVSAVLGELCIAASILTATAFLVGRAPPS